MGFSSNYLDCFHYSDGLGYLIFCCHSVATEDGLKHLKQADYSAEFVIFFADYLVGSF